MVEHTPLLIRVAIFNRRGVLHGATAIACPQDDGLASGSVQGGGYHRV